MVPVPVEGFVVTGVVFGNVVVVHVDVDVVVPVPWLSVPGSQAVIPCAAQRVIPMICMYETNGFRVMKDPRLAVGRDSQVSRECLGLVV